MEPNSITLLGFEHALTFPMLEQEAQNKLRMGVLPGTFTLDEVITYNSQPPLMVLHSSQSNAFYRYTPRYYEWQDIVKRFPPNGIIPSGTPVTFRTNSNPGEAVVTIQNIGAR